MHDMKDHEYVTLTNMHERKITSTYDLQIHDSLIPRKNTILYKQIKLLEESGRCMRTIFFTSKSESNSHESHLADCLDNIVKITI